MTTPISGLLQESLLQPQFPINFTGSVPPPPGGLGIPNGAFLKQRFGNIAWVGPTVVGPNGEPAQEVVQIVRLQTQEVNVSYRWQGFLFFEPVDYDFTVVATNGLRVTVAGDTIIDDVVLTPSRAATARKTMPAGTSLVTVDWFNPSGAGSIQLDVSAVPTQSWVSCVDGQIHAGLPPSGFVLSPNGCWQAPLSGSTTALNLASIVKVAPALGTPIQRSYILKSGLAQQPARFAFFNCAVNMSVKVQLLGPPQVKFLTAFQFVGDVGVGGLPADSFELQPRSQMLVDMVFDNTQLDLLAEGLNQASIFINLAPGSITLPSTGDSTITVGLCPDITLPGQATGSSTGSGQPPTATWLDCSTGTPVQRTGSPPSTWIMRPDGCFIPPPSTGPTVTLDFTPSQLPSIVLGGVTTTLRATLAGSLVGDDPTTYTYSWNFDVLTQGDGVGVMSALNTSAAWQVTSMDIINGQFSQTTTRTVELVAVKGATVLRARKQILFTGIITSQPTSGGGTGTGTGTGTSGGGGTFRPPSKT